MSKVGHTLFFFFNVLFLQPSVSQFLRPNGVDGQFSNAGYGVLLAGTHGCQNTKKKLDAANVGLRILAPSIL